jgi:hypothetical protein
MFASFETMEMQNLTLPEQKSPKSPPSVPNIRRAFQICFSASEVEVKCHFASRRLVGMMYRRI